MGAKARRSYLYSSMPGTPFTGRGQHRGVIASDGRTRAAQHLKRVRKALFEELAQQDGREPSAKMCALIERAAFLDLRCSLFEQKLLDGTYTELDSRTHCAAINTQRRLFSALGLRNEPAFARLMRRRKPSSVEAA